ncbi:hypothetical protein GCK32_014007 [Trichostrongylus colubriformis]|uniref:Uncharacterized protein n=1 Tax=Trichostrongylus colubriformis TaxID=6319 RepID=A0AAN8FM94_TRICO
MDVQRYFLRPSVRGLRGAWKETDLIARRRWHYFQIEYCSPVDEWIRDRFDYTMWLKQTLRDWWHRAFPSKKERLQEAGIEVKAAEQLEEVNKKTSRTVFFQDHNFD